MSIWTDSDRYDANLTRPLQKRQFHSKRGYLAEFKVYSGGVSPKELAIMMTAFENIEGDAICLGVTDQRLIQGVTVNPMLLDHIQNVAREGCSPPRADLVAAVPGESRQISVAEHTTAD